MHAVSAVSTFRSGRIAADCNDLDAAFAKLGIPEISDRGREFLRGLNEILEAVLPDFDEDADGAPQPHAKWETPLLHSDRLK